MTIKEPGTTVKESARPLREGHEGTAGRSRTRIRFRVRLAAVGKRQKTFAVWSAATRDAAEAFALPALRPGPATGNVAMGYDMARN
ncbi:hypothetical protein ACFVUY_21660 [Kitasatospora sp. NPDC058063]|uniref:hypothetical protein n=1 Tax=unclassified Kitasatospora TaxID=2633591 RepID=UPI0036DCA537